jgi:hypothetical protein
MALDGKKLGTFFGQVGAMNTVRGAKASAA